MNPKIQRLQFSILNENLEMTFVSQNSRDDQRINNRSHQNPELDSINQTN